MKKESTLISLLLMVSLQVFGSSITRVTEHPAIPYLAASVSLLNEVRDDFK